MPTRNVVLTDKQAELIEQLVDSGRYQNASEVLRGALDEAEAAVAARDLYDYGPTLFDTVEEEERVSAAQA